MRRGTTAVRLRVADGDHAVVRAWQGHDLLSAADAIRQEMLGAGTCLPAVQVEGATVVPLVAWDTAALAQRLESGLGPVLDLVTIRDRLEEGIEPEAPTLRILGWVVISAITRSWDGMARLAPLGPVIAGVVGRPRPWTLTECDLLGYTVAAVRGEGFDILVRGHRGPRPGTSPLALSVRSWQEQLFDVSLRCGMHGEAGGVSSRV